MKKRRRQRFLSLMLVLCMIASAGMMTPLSTSADSTDVNLTEETQQAESALTGGVAADQIQAAAADTETDIVSVTQNQETMTAEDTQTADSGAVPEEAAAPAAEQVGAGTEQTGAGIEQSDPAVPESANLAETPSESQAAEGQTEVSTDGTQGTVNTEAPAADEEQKTEQKQDSEETEVSWPAQTFTGHANNITVNVTAAEGIFPEGTTMVTTAVSVQTAKAIANAASDAEAEVVDAIGVDISFRDASGNEIEPKDGKNVQVSMTVDAASTLSGDSFSVVHQSDNGNVQKVTENATAEGAVFESGEFSIYVITGEGIAQTPAVATYIFHGADGKEISTQKVKNGETVYAPTTPEKAGSKFLGWSYTQGVSSIQEGDPGNFGTLTASVSTTGEVHLYPVFQEAYYVFFLDNQGRVSTTKEGASGDDISVEDVVIPLDSTHSVTGWYTEAKLTNKVESVTLSDHNVTLYPKVEEGHYLYFSSGEGASYVKPVFVAAGKYTVEPEAPTRPGYTFKYWSVSEDGSAEYAFGSTISKDTTLYAVWEADNNTEYTVIFWKQSVNDSKNAKDSEKTYDYAESDTRTGKTGATVSPTINDQKKAYTGFTYNDSKSTQVTINGDGTTILNVYYDRNLLTINFYKRQYVWSSWAIDKTFTGLYGQTLGLYGYTWPDENDWYNKDHSKRLTFLDAFIFDTLNDYGNDKTINLYGYKSDGRIEVKHYKQNLDGSYSYNRPANTTKSVGGTFYFSNKYTGFTVDSFVVTGNQPKESDKWKTASPNGSTYFSANLHIRYTRNTYKLAYYNYNNVVKEGELLYEASLNSYSSYVPTRPAGLPEAYTFQGWFKDKECTVPFDFDSTMPANDVMIYAKWAAPTYTATVHTKMEGTGTPIQLTINYGSKINENDMPTVKDSDGNIILEGSSSNTVTVPKGNTWAGWATKSGDDFTIYNFNTQVHGDITLYPYYINGEKYGVTYILGEGTGKAPTDIKQYAENAYADIQPASGITPPKGMTFLYWSHGTDKYYPGDKVKITGNLELTAVYGETSPLTSITYHSNYPEGSELKEKITTIDNKANNTAITLEKAGFTAPTGYYFAYWEDASGKRYDVGTKIGIDNDNTFANDLYAVWEQKKEITLTANSGTFTYDGTEHTSSGVVTDTFVIDGVTYTVSGYTTESPVKTDAGTYTNNISGTYAVKGNNGIDVTDHFTIQTVDGSLTISKRTVHLKSESASKPFDGTPLTRPDVIVSGDGFVDGEVSNLKAKGSITKAGSVTNTIEYIENSGFKADNYEIKKNEGTLTITANTAAIEVRADSDSKTYDGTALTKNSYSVTGLPEGFAAEATVTGSITDTGTADNVISSVVIRKGNENVTDQFSNVTKTNGTLTVTVRKVTLTSGSASKAYDGVALTRPEVTIAGDGFVTGEVSDVKAAGSITKVGSATNTIKYNENNGFKASNYEITKIEGTLRITANTAAIKVTADSASKTYDGTPLTKNIYRIEGLPEGFTEKVTVSGTITDAGTAVNEVKSAVILKDGKDVTDQFTNIENASGTLTVNKRTVNLKSDSASKVFDGTALTAPDVTVTGDGFVTGEVTDLKAVGTITKAGSVKNEIRYTEKSGFKADNYTITKDEGILTITQNEDEIVVNAKNASRAYDGTALTEGGSEVIGLPNGYTAEVTVTGSITDVGTAENKVTSVVIKKGDEDVTDQFKTITENNGTLTITKRNVTLTSESQTREYNGTALTAPNVTVGGDGFVDGEATDIKATGSITKAGSAANPITYTEGTGFKAGNYEIRKTEGTLTVTANTAEITVTAGSDSKTYDGEVLTKSTYTINGLPAGFTPTVMVSGSITSAGTADNVVTSVVIRKDGEDVTDQFSNIRKAKGTLTVTKRMVHLESVSASKQYDGTALTAPDVTVSGDGFVTGEVTNLKATGSITDVGSTENAISYTKELGKFKENNYIITKQVGTLTVDINTTEITFTAADGNKEYDGTALTASDVTVTGLPEGFTAEGVAAGSIVNVWESGNDDNRNNHVVKVAIYNGDGKEVTGYFKNVKKVAGILTITPKSITLKSGSATKPFDGKPLTNHTLVLGDDIISLTMLADKNDLTIADDDKLALGIAEKDQITFNFTGSQTYIGSSKNEFDCTIVSGKTQTRVQPSLAEALKTADQKEEDDKVSKNYAENYEISLEFGELEVTDNEVTPDKVVTKTHEDKTYQIGDSIEFTINVTNIYDDVRTIILQEQDGVTFEDGADSVTFENVKPGETISAKAVHVVTAADIEAGEYRNTVKAVFEKAGGSEPGGNPDEPGKTWEASDTEDDFAHMTISKEVTSNPKNGSKYVAGETVTYRITVTNDGTVALTGLVITDDLTNATWTADSLMAGDTLTYTTSYTVTAADAANGSVTNVVAGQADGLNTPDPGTATVTTEAEESEEPENPEPTQPTKPEETVTPTPVPVEPEEPEPEEPTKPEEPTQPEKPVIRPQTTVTPTPLVTVPPTELPSTRPVHTGNTIRKNPDTIQEQRTKLVHTGAVQTGDAGMIGVNVIIVLGAAAGIGVLIRKRKKEKKQ